MPLLTEDGEALFGPLVSDQGVSSDNKIMSGRIESVDCVEDEEVMMLWRYDHPHTHYYKVSVCS